MAIKQRFGSVGIGVARGLTLWIQKPKSGLLRILQRANQGSSITLIFCPRYRARYKSSNRVESHSERLNPVFGDNRQGTRATFSALPQSPQSYPPYPPATAPQGLDIFCVHLDNPHKNDIPGILDAYWISLFLPQSPQSSPPYPPATGRPGRHNPSVYHDKLRKIDILAGMVTCLLSLAALVILPTPGLSWSLHQPHKQDRLDIGKT